MDQMIKSGQTEIRFAFRWDFAEVLNLWCGLTNRNKISDTQLSLRTKISVRTTISNLTQRKRRLMSYKFFETRKLNVSVVSILN